ncbi:hypothetical protein AcW1_003799 [Taiwanofungus camphoratus]|nr:hypothetical protein AcV5_003518 [Antrodia cinnamomea]KAI0940663.1 hypothetical protein AcW1_003799 [Antrodia cinnamomea]KAI0958164.1 hypothetical protein AcV7_004054 [Antrodia cinnamomea]
MSTSSLSSGYPFSCVTAEWHLLTTSFEDHPHPQSVRSTIDYEAYLHAQIDGVTCQYKSSSGTRTRITTSSTTESWALSWPLPRLASFNFRSFVADKTSAKS